jgi:hypothetical protein
MEKRLLNEFLSLFSGLSDAIGIIKGDAPDVFIHQWTQRINELALKMQMIHTIPRESNVLYDAINEIEGNLYQNNANNRAIYLGQILRGFFEIEPYLNIVKDRRYIDNNLLDISDIGVTRYGDHIKLCNDIIKRYCRWIKPEFDYTNASIPERYIIQCFDSYNTFFILLDRKCLDFELDIMEVQKGKCIDVYNRQAHDMSDRGYNRLIQSQKEPLPTAIKPPRFTRSFTPAEQKKLYEGLKNGGFLPQETICSHFYHVFGGTAIPDNEKPFKPLQWVGTIKELSYFITKHFPKQKNQWETAVNCFLIDNKPINKKSLSTAIDKYDNPPESSTAIDSLL